MSAKHQDHFTYNHDLGQVQIAAQDRESVLELVNNSNEISVHLTVKSLVITVVVLYRVTAHLPRQCSYNPHLWKYSSGSRGAASTLGVYLSKLFAALFAFGRDKSRLTIGNCHKNGRPSAPST
jgi:hypothetical protein